MESTYAEQQKEKRKINEDMLRELFWDSMKCPNIHITGIPEGEERKSGGKLI